ncbi:MAG: DUF1249 domain-containing protein [Nevskiales bacterium]|nr:DUF1249 domain-containing protein [Nevskiales bacterium]
MTTATRFRWWTPRARPVRIGALLELYERNFRLVECLVPELELPFDAAVSYSASDPVLTLKVLERGGYTSTFRLTYEFPRTDAGPHRIPDLKVRVYRDARLAEALNGSLREAWPAKAEDEAQAWQYLDGQWERNLLLHKWLQYLLEQGHGFGLAARPRRENVPVSG